jgi:glycosyl hydrolase family 99
MPVNRRLVAATVVLLTLLMMLQVGQASGSTPYLTRLRVELSGTSDWEAFQIDDASIPTIRVESVTSGAYVTHNDNRIALNGVRGATAVVSMIVEVMPDDTFTLVQGKGSSGTSRAKVYRTNTTQTLVADISNTTSSGDATVYRDVSRSLLVGEGLTIPRVDSRRLVLSFYYPWFGQGTFDSGPWYDEPTSAYRTDDPDDVAAMVSQAQNAGIDGFVVSWDDVGNHTANFDLVLDAAQNRAFYVTPLIELNAFSDGSGNYNLPAIVTTIKKALARSTNAKFLTSGGKPVVFVYGIYHLAPSEWRSIVNDVAASGKTPFYVGEDTDTAYALNGVYLYNPNGQGPDQLANAYNENQQVLRYPAMLDSTVAQRLWAATVSPGQNFSYFEPLRPRNEARDNGDRYAATWQAALNSSPEWVLITSWNEWFEATHISPSKKFGWTALNQTADWSQTFHFPQPDTSSTDSTQKKLLQFPPLLVKV